MADLGHPGGVCQILPPPHPGLSLPPTSQAWAPRDFRCELGVQGKQRKKGMKLERAPKPSARRDAISGAH